MQQQQAESEIKEKRPERKRYQPSVSLMAGVSLASHKEEDARRTEESRWRDPKERASPFPQCRPRLYMRRKHVLRYYLT